MENQYIEKLGKLLEKVTREKKNGNRVRHLTRVISKAYSENPEELRQYFNSEDSLVSGIATSAYHFLTGDMAPIQEKDFGGLGAIINNSEKGLEFNHHQLWYSKNSGDALGYSKNSGDALENSNNSGDALWGSKNSEYALWKSKNSGDVLRGSKNKDGALRYSENSGYALMDSKNSGYALRDSKNSIWALWHSKNNENALLSSKRSWFNRIFVRFDKE